LKTDAPILRAVGDKGAQFFKQSFELKIKGDLIPEAAAEEIIGELQALFARHNAEGGPQREGRIQAHQGIPHRPPYAVFSGREYGDR
jgi:hypothetical protein